MSKELINKIEKVFKDSTYCGWGSVLEELKQTLTPPNLNDLRDEIKVYIIEMFNHKVEVYFSNKGDRITIQDLYSNWYKQIEIGIKGHISWNGLSFKINIAHKITTYFKLLSEVSK
jgi:hypothetical protein